MTLDQVDLRAESATATQGKHTASESGRALTSSEQMVHKNIGTLSFSFRICTYGVNADRSNDSLEHT